jgi:hypothetical protein
VGGSGVGVDVGGSGVLVGVGVAGSGVDVGRGVAVGVGVLVGSGVAVGVEVAVGVGVGVRVGKIPISRRVISTIPIKQQTVHPIIARRARMTRTARPGRRLISSLSLLSIGIDERS